MPRYRITTVVDITRALIVRDEKDIKKQSQRSNFNSLIQAIGLRANPDWISDPLMQTGRLPSPFDGKGNYWTWEFDIEREDVFLSDGDPVKLLKQDLHGVPVLIGLDDNVEIHPSIFNIETQTPNTYLEII